MANKGQHSVFRILYSYYYETAPTPPLACRYEPGVGLLTTTNHPPSPPPLPHPTSSTTSPPAAPPHHQQHHQQPTTANEGQRRSTKTKRAQTTPDTSFGP